MSAPNMFPTEFGQPMEPWDYDQPQQRLVPQLRAMRLGGTIELARGIVVKAVAVPHGASQVRRYYVGAPGSRRRNSEQQRHDGTVKSASEAAQLAIEQSKALGRPSRQED